MICAENYAEKDKAKRSSEVGELFKEEEINRRARNGNIDGVNRP